MRRRALSVLMVSVLVGSLSTVAAHASETIAPNDDFANATPVTALPTVVHEDFLVATSEVGEPIQGDCLNQSSTWFKMTLSAAQPVSVLARDAYQVAVYKGTTMQDLEPISCEIDGAAFYAEADTTYHVQIIHFTIPRPNDVIFERVTRLSGRVTTSDGGQVQACVDAYGGPGGWYYYGAVSDANGNWQMTGLARGDYRLYFYPCNEASTYAGEYYNDAQEWREADPIRVESGDDITGIDAELAAVGLITGTVTDQRGDPVDGVCVSVHGPTEVSAHGYAYDGKYSAQIPESGEYKVSFADCWSGGRYKTEWYSDKADFESADPVTVTVGAVTSGIDAELADSDPPPNDHFANAAAIAQLPYSDSPNAARATVEDGEPDRCRRGVQRTVWYRYTPASDQLVVAQASGGWPAITVYEQGLLGLEPQNCSYAIPGAPSSSVDQSRVVSNLRQGTTYFFQVSVPYGGLLKFSLTEVASTASETFTTSMPCGVFCPYWQPVTSTASSSMTAEKHERSCLPTPDSPAGSWDDVSVTIPEQIDGNIPSNLVLYMDPEADYDAFICRAEPNSSGKYYVAVAANYVGELCTDQPGCIETAVVRVLPGERYVIRGYNWADTAPAIAQYGYLTRPPVVGPGPVPVPVQG